MPSKSNFDWALIRSFLAALDAGSLTAAARVTGTAQPTLSRHLLELESQLGAALFERTGRGVVPTAAALAIAGAARRMGDEADALQRAIEASRNQTTGTVRITTSMVAAVHLLPPLLAQLSAQEPGIHLECVASNQITNLLRREADIAIRMTRPVQGSLVARKLADIEIGAYAHEYYLARAGSPRRPDDLRNHRLIGFDRDETIIRGFAALGLPLDRERFSVRTDDQVAYIELVAQGAGIGFVASYTVANRPGVIRVLPELKIPPLPCWLAVHREIHASQPIRRVVDFLAAALPRELNRRTAVGPGQHPAQD